MSKPAAQKEMDRELKDASTDTMKEEIKSSWAKWESGLAEELKMMEGWKTTAPVKGVEPPPVATTTKKEQKAPAH